MPKLRLVSPTTVSLAAGLLIVFFVVVVTTTAPYRLSFFDTYVSDGFVSNSTVTVARVPKGCDIFHGEWVPDDAVPYYTNRSCVLIQEHQNCIHF